MENVKILTLLMVLLFIIPFSFAGINGLFGPKIPPGQAPGYVCSIIGCQYLGNATLNGNTIFDGNLKNVSISDSLLHNVTIIDSTIINITGFNLSIIDDLYVGGDFFVDGNIRRNNMLMTEDMLRLNPINNAPQLCSALILGAIYYDISEDDMCVCKSTGWKVMTDGTDCT